MNKPPIRNKGCADDSGKLIPFAYEWKQHKLSEVADKVTQKNTELKYRETLTNSAEYGIINQTEFFDKEISNVDKIDGYYIVHHDDFVYNPRISSLAPVGPINRNRLNKTGITSPLYTVFQTHDVDTLFLEWLFKSNVWHSFMRLNGDSGARSDRFSIKTDLFFTMPINLPDSAEQKLIGDFFEQLNTTITLHQLELIKLNNMKKGFLQKLFPQGNSKVPEIRFNGYTDGNGTHLKFTGDWQQHKLETLCDLFADGDWIETKDQSNSGIRLVQTGNIGIAEYLDKPNNKKWITEETFNRLHCTEIYPGDILISRLPEPAGRACIVPDLGARMITAVDCTIARVSSKYSNEYLVQYLSTYSHFNTVSSLLGGGTRQRITRGNLSELDIPVPPTIEEQKTIGSFLRKMDELITLQQRELDILMRMKTGFLQKMYI